MSHPVMSHHGLRKSLASRWAFLLAVALTLAAGQASAWDFSIEDHDFTLDLTDTFKYTYHFDDPEGGHSVGSGHSAVQLLKHYFYNTLDAALSHDVFRVGTRMDLNLFAGRAFEDACTGAASQPGWCEQKDRRYVQSFALERIYFTAALPEFDLTLGDFYASLGKGMALRVVKQQELSQDNAIRGGKLDVHYRNLGVTLLGGAFNFLDIDEPKGLRSPWHGDPVVAARLEYRFADLVLAGAHVVYIMSECNSGWCEEISGSSNGRGNLIDLGSDLVVGSGFDIPDLFDGLLSMSAEVDLQQTIKHGGTVVRAPWRKNVGKKGVAFYGSTTLQVGDLTVLGEGKYYDGFELKAPQARDESILGFKMLYHQPPTLERITALINNNTSVGGLRVKADYYVGELGPVELLVYANLGFFRNWDNEESGANGKPVEAERQVWNPYAGAELSWMEGEGNLKISGGVRDAHDLHFDRTFMRDGFLEIDLEQVIHGPHSMKLTVDWLARRKDGLETHVALGQTPGRKYKDWNELAVFINYKWSPYMEAVLGYERQEDPAISRRNYFSGSLRYYFTPGTFVNLWVGSTRPGVKCLNGACRRYPALSGVQVTVVGRL